MTKQTTAQKALNSQIERIYYAHCSGVQISIMDIGKVFAAGHAAAAAGTDITTAILEAVTRLRVN